MTQANQNNISNPSESGIMQRVVCAAVQYSNGITLVAPRHFDAVMRDQYHRFFTQGTAPREQDGVQGFLDQHGEFLTREEAWLIAEKSGQIIRRVGGDGKKLFSENLY